MHIEEIWEEAMEAIIGAREAAEALSGIMICTRTHVESNALDTSRKQALDTFTVADCTLDAVVAQLDASIECLHEVRFTLGRAKQGQPATE